MSELPKGWREILLAQGVEIVRGVTFSKSERLNEPTEGYIPCLRTSNIQQEIETDDLAYIPSSLVKRNDRFVQPGDVIISMSNSAELVGKVAKAKSHHSGFAFGAFLSALRTTKFDSDFLYYLFRSSHIQTQLRATASQTVNIANLSLAGISNIVLPLPPLDEQRRIVAKLDALFARTQRARAELERVPKLIERAKQAVLAKAFAGELTREWRDDSRHQLETGEQLLQRILARRREQYNGNGKYKEPQAPDRRDLSELPNGWMWARMEQLIVDIRSGTTAVPQDEVTPYPIIRSSSVRTMSVDLNDVRYLSNSNFNINNLIRDGDLLFTRLSGSLAYVGNCALAKNISNKETAYPDRVFRVRLVEQDLAKYIEVCFASPQMRKIVSSLAKSTAGHQRISQGLRIMNWL